jgi:hypothetical protein
LVVIFIVIVFVDSCSLWDVNTIHLDLSFFLDNETRVLAFRKEEDEICVPIQFLHHVGDQNEAPAVKAVQQNVLSVLLRHYEGIPVVISVLIVLHKVAIYLLLISFVYKVAALV